MKEDVCGGRRSLSLLLLFILICLQSLLQVSCSVDELRPDFESHALKLSFDVEEALVSGVQLFLYSEGRFVSGQYVEQPVGKEISVNIIRGKTYSIYAIANLGKIPTDPSLRREEDMKRSRWTISEEVLREMDPGQIPMAGSLEKRVLSDRPSHEITLSRLLSKFRIVIDKSRLDADVQFDIRSIGLRNVNVSVPYFSEGKAVSDSEVLDRSCVKSGDALADVHSRGVVFYLPENAQGNLLSGNVGETTHVPPPPYDRLCTYVELVVDYRSRTHYDDRLTYRYYLHDGRAMDNFDVLRNRFYDCRTTFTGSGIREHSWRLDVSSLKSLVTSVKISPETHVFREIGEQKVFSVTVLPAAAENGRVVWSSSDPEVASVDAEGRVTAVGDGQCEIVAVSTDGTEVSDRVRVEVSSRVFPVAFRIDPGRAQLLVGESLQLRTVAEPEGAECGTVSWFSGDASVATVDGTGKVTARRIGKSTVRAVTEFGKREAVAEIEVKEKIFEFLNFPPVLYPGYNVPHRIEYRAEPYERVRFSLKSRGVSGNMNPVTLEGTRIDAYNPKNQNGTIGHFLLTAVCHGVIHTLEFEVNGGEVSVREEPEVHYFVNGTYPFSVGELVPADASCTWTVSDPAVAEIDPQTGVLYAKSTGPVFVQLLSQTGARDVREIVVKKPEIGLEPFQEIYEGQTADLVHEASPGLHLRWTILEGEEFVRMDSSGQVTGLRRTSAEETVRLSLSCDEDPSLVRYCQLKVLPAVEAELAGGGVLLNVSDHPSTVAVSGYPTQVQIATSAAPGNSLFWKIYDADGRLSYDLSVAPSGKVRVHEGGANGLYTLVGEDASGRYFTDPIRLKVFKYLGYEVGLALDGTTVSEAGEFASLSVTYEYDLLSRWSGASAVSVFSPYADCPLRELQILTWEGGSRYPVALSSSGSDNVPVTFAQDLVLTTSYNPQFTVWDDLTPVSRISDPVTGRTAEGRTGMAFELEREKHFYYVRQERTEFYNMGEF